MGPLSAFHAHAAQAAGEADEARAVARAAVESWRGTEDRVDAIGLLGAACEVLPAAEAKPVRAELAVAAEAGAPLARALLPYAEGWAARSAGPKVAAFREASARFAEAGLQWWSARALMLAGEAGGVKPDAVEDLLEARRLFREMEAPGWRAQCEAALRARGHKFVMASRHRDSSGLSEREVEVLEQLALGLTNREIGHRLYISEKTVGRHLERIFAKLAVTSRTAAVSAAQELGIVTEVAAQVVTTP
jgi:DNA-binding CsgD family transcriptional regulator